MSKDNNNMNNKMKYVTVLDNKLGEVWQYEVGNMWNPDEQSLEQFLDSEGHNINECTWMCHNDGKIRTRY